MKKIAVTILLIALLPVSVMAVNRNNTYRNVNFTLSYDVVENTLL